MSYRDPRVARRQRLAELEVERARLAGRRQGLELALAESRERVERARELARTTGGRLARGIVRGAGWVTGFFGGGAALVLGAGLCAAVPVLLFGGSGDEPESRTGRIEASTWEGFGEGEACAVTIAEGSADQQCRATVRCGERTLYRGAPRCMPLGTRELREAWDAEGGGRFAFAPRLGLLVVRGPEGAVRVRVSPP